MRQYTEYDLLRFGRFASKNPELKPMELIKLYDKTYPELTSKQKLINISIFFGINGLHKALTGIDIPQEDLDNMK